MAVYRLELAKSDRSSCRECGKQIANDTPRFGTSDNPPGSRWFHLECAPVGAPRAFKPFERSAVAFQSKAPKAGGPTRAGASAIARDLELEAAIIRAPKQRKAKLVYADWLQEHGDPWGEHLALVLAGEAVAAAEVFKQHQVSLTGSFNHRWLRWAGGVIERAGLEARNASHLAVRYAELRALRTAAFLESLALQATLPDEALVRAISSDPPPLLRSLFLWVGPGLGALELPRLTALTLCITRPVGAALTPLFALERRALPRLRALELYDAAVPDRALPRGALEQLLASPLLPGLRRLSLYQGALNGAGLDFLVNHAGALEHLDELFLGNDLTPAQERRAQRAFGAALTRAASEEG